MSAFVVREGCPACAHSSSQTLYRCSFQEPPVSTFLISYYGADAFAQVPPGDYQVESCDACNTLFQKQVGDEALLAQLYGDWLDFVIDPEAEIPTYRFSVHHPRLSRDGHEIMAAAATLGRTPSELVTLDFGMGWAEWARVAVALGCRSHGTDLSDNRMAYAAAHGVRTIAATELAGLGADLVNAEQVFEHVTEPRSVMRACADALAPGGILKIGVPAQADVRHQLAHGIISMPGIMPVHPLEHVNAFTKTALIALGAEQGLHPVKPGYRARYAYLRQRGWKPAKLANLLKEAARPFYTFRSKRSMTLWLRKIG